MTSARAAAESVPLGAASILILLAGTPACARAFATAWARSSAVRKLASCWRAPPAPPAKRISAGLAVAADGFGLPAGIDEGVGASSGGGGGGRKPAAASAAEGSAAGPGTVAAARCGGGGAGRAASGCGSRAIRGETRLDSRGPGIGGWPGLRGPPAAAGLAPGGAGGLPAAAPGGSGGGGGGGANAMLAPARRARSVLSRSVRLAVRLRSIRARSAAVATPVGGGGTEARFG